MTLTIRFFARTRDLAGVDSVEMDIPEGATVADLRRRLGATYPALSGLLSRSRVAVQAEFAEDSWPLTAGTEVALLPPVSGG